MKILIVEDEASLQETLAHTLQSQGFVTEAAGSLAAALEKIALYRYDVLLLDIGLPDGSGMKALQQLKHVHPDTGVLILSAKNSLDDKLQGLDWGADDYMTKPFHAAELIARLKAIFRRRNFQGRIQVEIGGMLLFPEEKRLIIQAAEVPLTPKEFDLLLHFASNEGRVMTKAEIAEHLWGDMADSFDDFDFIYAHVKNLRKKLLDHGGEDCIKTVYGVGYRFAGG
jgi:DNA-binding response OmpR family regulator